MIVASICTIPGRTASLLAVLTDLLKQSVLPNMLLITVADYYPRSGKYFPDEDLARIESFLEKYFIPSQVVKVPLDIGPCQKLLTPVMHPMVKSNDLILTIDDDALLAGRAIESLFHSWNKNSDAVYSIMGGRAGKFVHQERMPANFDYFVVDVAGGYRGILYSMSLIDKAKFRNYIDDMISAHRAQNMIAMHDDHIFSYYFKMNGIERRVAAPVQARETLDYSHIPNTDGIMNDPNSAISMELIRKYFENNDLGWVISNPH